MPSLKAELKVLAAAAKRDGVLLQSFKSLKLNMGLPDTVAGVLLEAGVWESIEGEAEREGDYVLGLGPGRLYGSECGSLRRSTLKSGQA